MDERVKWGPKPGDNVIRPDDTLPDFHLKRQKAHHKVVKNLENNELVPYFLPSGQKLEGETVAGMGAKLKGAAYQRYLKSLNLKI